MKLLTPVMLGEIALANRIIMAPMTRSRATENAVPTSIMVDYYRQRASAGLIISEGIAPSASGLGYCRTPGIYNDEQITVWRSVTDAVHEAGGKMVAQLMHVGRVASHYNKPAGCKTVAPTALKAKGQVFTDKAGMQDYDCPQELTVSEIESVIEEYRQATKNAFAAGFDGVELHCTSGYLPAQFLSTGTNQRTDSYGGSVQNRIRFVVEVLESMISVQGAARVAIRICPDNPFNDLHDENPEETFRALLKALSKNSLAYVHVIRFPQGRVNNIALAREYFPNSLVLNESYSAEEAELSVEGGESKAVSFGRPFIANPDLPKRIELAANLKRFTIANLYTGGASGYTDYPLLDDG